MEEEAVQPGGSEETMLERLFSYYGSAQGENKGETSTVASWNNRQPDILLTLWRECFLCVAAASLLLRGEKPHFFLLGHSHGTDWVEYNAQGWLSHAKHNPATQNAATLLQDSQKYDRSAMSNPCSSVYVLHIQKSTSELSCLGYLSKLDQTLNPRHSSLYLRNCL